RRVRPVVPVQQNVLGLRGSESQAVLVRACIYLRWLWDGVGSRRQRRTQHPCRSSTRRLWSRGDAKRPRRARKSSAAYRGDGRAQRCGKAWPLGQVTPGEQSPGHPLLKLDSVGVAGKPQVNRCRPRECGDGPASLGEAADLYGSAPRTRGWSRVVSVGEVGGLVG